MKARIPGNVLSVLFSSCHSWTQKWGIFSEENNFDAFSPSRGLGSCKIKKTEILELNHLCIKMFFINFFLKSTFL